MSIHVVHRSAGGEQTIRVTEGPLRFGREEDNDVVLPEDHVSRYHASALRREGWLEIWDLVDNGSRSGTFLRGIRIAPHMRHPLADGDEVRFGNDGPTALAPRIRISIVATSVASKGRSQDARPSRTKETVVGGNYLTDQEISNVHTAIINAGLAQNWHALLAGLLPKLVSGFHTANASAPQILRDLHDLNSIDMGINGDIPLKIVLMAAQHLSRGRSEELVFKTVIRGMR